MEYLYFFGGLFVGAVGIWCFLSSNYDLVESVTDEESETQKETVEEEDDETVVEEGFDDETEDDSNYFYVKFPHQPRPIEICIEEQLEAGHYLYYRDENYRITAVQHKSDGHTVFLADLIIRDNG